MLFFRFPAVSSRVRILCRRPGRPAVSPARPPRRPSAAPVLCLVLAGLLWGTGGLTGTLLGRAAGLSPLSVAALRLLGGGALIVAFRIIPGRRWPAGRAAWTRVAVTGLLAATFQGAYFSAVSLTSVSLATLVTIGATPVIVLVAELVLGRRRLDRAAVTRTALALAGLGLLVGLPAGGYGTAAVLDSAGMALLASAGFATLTLIGSIPVPGLGDETVTGLGFTAGGLVLLPLAAVAGGWRSGRRSRRSAGWRHWPPGRPRWPTRCTSAACARRPRAPARCFRCSSRSPRRSSAWRSSATASARRGWRARSCSPRRSSAPPVPVTSGAGPPGWAGSRQATAPRGPAVRRGLGR